MATTKRTLRLDDERWERLNQIADRVVPSTHYGQRGRNVNVMLRLISDGHLIVRRTDEQEEGALADEEPRLHRTTN